MASFFSITVGQQAEFQRVLAKAGFSAELVMRIIREPYLASVMCASIVTLPPTTPVWYVSPAEQLERARQLWPDAVLPEPPKGFAPRTKSEVLLLHVPDTFDSLWDKVVAPTGYTKYRREDFKKVQHVFGKVMFTEPVWLAFDPEHGKGVRPDSLWGQANLAASEVFSALIQFPEWPLAWFNGASAPYLSGYQLKFHEKWSHVPCFYRHDDHRELVLSDNWAQQPDEYWASPTVREC